jgi:hypothetical protein
MSKLIFYADIDRYKVGDIVYGEIDDKGSIFIFEFRYTVNSSDTEEEIQYKKFCEKYFAVRCSYGYPVMRLEDFREQQIKTILDD